MVLRNYLCLKNFFCYRNQKKVLNFEELKEYLLKYRAEYSLAEDEFYEKEKTTIVGITIDKLYYLGGRLRKIKSSPEYFEISKDITKRLFVINQRFLDGSSFSFSNLLILSKNFSAISIAFSASSLIVKLSTPYWLACLKSL